MEESRHKVTDLIKFVYDDYAVDESKQEAHLHSSTIG